MKIKESEHYWAAFSDGVKRLTTIALTGPTGEDKLYLVESDLPKYDTLEFYEFHTFDNGMTVIVMWHDNVQVYDTRGKALK